MWHIENPELRPGKLDFTSSGQGWNEVTQVFVDEVQLINAVELIDWNLLEDTQFLICESCGFEHCKQGDWVRIRRSGSLIVILPAFGYVWARLPEDRREYSPPKYLREHGGIGYVEQSTYENLHSQNRFFPAFESIPPLKMREATLLFHLTAPAQVLGVAPEIRVNEAIIAGSSEGLATPFVTQLEHLVRSQYNDESHALLRPLTEHDQTVSIYLDAEEFIDWKALVLERDDYRLVVDSRFIIVNDE